MIRITDGVVQTNGLKLHVAEAGQGPLVLLLHGWPESSYSWRHQLPALAAAGYHAVAPDIRGYGQSDKPNAVEAYRMSALLDDVTGLMDAFGERSAVLVGHDWGAAMAWTFAALRPERARAVVGLSVPHLGRAPMPPTQLFKTIFDGQWFYVLYFQEPGVAEAELEADVPKTLRAIFTGDALDPMSAVNRTKRLDDGLLTGIDVPESLPTWLTEGDFSHYCREIAASGFRGGLNRYRNMDRDWEELPALATAKVVQPALFIVGERDPGRSIAPIDQMTQLVPNLKEVCVVPGAGHWLQQECPAEVNAALLTFLQALSK